MPASTAHTIADLALAQKRVKVGLILIGEQRIRIERAQARGEDVSELEQSLKTMIGALRIMVSSRDEIEAKLLNSRLALN